MTGLSKKIILFLLIFITICFQVKSQNANIEDSIIPLSGPGAKQYTHPFIGFGFILGSVEGSGAKIIYGKSTDFNVGVRHKMRISNFESVCVDLAYFYDVNRLKQDSGKTLPNKTLHDKESVDFNNLELALGNRFTFGKHYKRMGVFLDFYGYAGWMFASTHYATDKYKIANAANASITQIKDTRPLYTNDYEYGVGARFGRNQIAVFAKYRLSDLFKSQYIYPELPRLVVGIQIGIHQ